MLSADRCARGGDATVAGCQHFHNLVHVERIADADAPGLALAVCSNRLDIAPRVDVEVAAAGQSHDLGRLVDRPALDYAGRVVYSVAQDIKIAVGLLPRALGQRED